MRRVAIVHEWLVTFGGSERVLEQMLRCYPDADLYATVDFLSAEQRAFLQGRPVRTSFIQRLPGARRHERFLPLMPLAVEQHDLSAYDLVLSSSHAVAKGVLTGPHQLHLSYCYTPMRYAWDLQHQYLRAAGMQRGVKSWLARWLLHRIRLWDVRTANGVDGFVAPSHYIERRIWKSYRRRAAVIAPPVDIERYALHAEKEDYYFIASRMVPYKQVPLVVRAFAGMPERRLLVAGDGPLMREARAAAASNVTLLGHLAPEALLRHMQRARAFMFAAEEDFGIAPLEAQACGTPVIAFGRGGVAETVRGLEHPQPTGVFFAEQTPEAIQSAVHRFEQEQHRLTPQACRANAERFGVARFRSAFTAFVEEAWSRFKGGEPIETELSAARALNTGPAGATECR